MLANAKRDAKGTRNWSVVGAAAENQYMPHKAVPPQDSGISLRPTLA